MNRLLKILLLAVIVAANAARLWNLDADFPSGLTWEGSPYTDEGQYASGAIAYLTTGQWYLEGDINAMISVPVFHLVQAFALKLMGFGLVSARMAEVLFFLVIVLCVYVLVRRYADASTALVATVLLSVNFTLFAYSRLAITELPTVSIGLGSIVLALSWPHRNDFLIGGLAAGLMFLAYLTKASALLLLPVLLYASAVRKTHLKDQIYAARWVLFVFTGLLSLYHAIMNYLYHEEYAYFSSRVFLSRFSLHPLAILANLPRTLCNGIFLDDLMYLLTLPLLFCPVFLLVSRKYQENPLVTLCYLWLFSFFAAMSACRYQPPRYYLTLSVPVTILFSVIAVLLYRTLKSLWWAYLPLVLIGLIALTNVAKIADYLQQPKYSFLAMSQDVLQRITLEQVPNPLLLGSIANSISLATGLPSLNDGLGVRDLRWKLARYQPTHYIVLGIGQETLALLNEFYQISQLAVYDVFGNYYGGQKVYFYKLTKR